MRRSLSTLVTLFILGAIGAASALAQGITLTTSPKRQTFPLGAVATYHVEIAAQGGFAATVNFEVIAPTLPWVSVRTSATKLNKPYSGGINVTVDPKSGHIVGTHMLVMHGWNGNVHAFDTCYLDVEPTRGWEHYTESNSPLPSNAINGFVVDKEGTGWIATNKGLARFDKKNWTTYTHNDYGGVSDDVLSVAVDSSNAVWITMRDSMGIARLKNGAWTSWDMAAPLVPPVDTLPIDHPTNFKPVTSLQVTSTGTVWGVHDGKLVRLDDGGAWTKLADHTVADILIDHSDVIWSAIPYSGVITYDGAYWSTGLFSLPSRFRSMSVDRRNHIWVVGDREVLRFANDTIGYVTGGGFPGSYPMALDFDNHGNVWLGSSNTDGDFAYGEGLAHFDGQVTTRYSVFNSGLPDDRVTRVKAGPDDVIWMQTRAPGIVLFNVERASGVEMASTKEATQGALRSAWPNPISSEGVVPVSITRPGPVRLTLHDALGQEVATVFDGTLDAGEKLLPIHAAGIPSGTYFLKLAMGSAIVTERLVITR